MRELANVITRAVLLTEASEVSRAALQLPPAAAPVKAAPHRTDETAKPELPEVGAPSEVPPARLAQVLRDTGWNVSRAAARLGLSRSQLRYRIDKHGLAPERPGRAGGPRDRHRDSARGPTGRPALSRHEPDRPGAEDFATSCDCSMSTEW